MTRIKFSQLVAVALFSLCLATAPAQATVDHTYVSGKGTDAGGCVSQATACRSFGFAITQTAAAGEIIVLDPADYGPVTITQSISIVADAGGPAGIILPTGNAITINAGAADVVNLRGLTLDGEATAGSGIVLNSAGTLTIADCVVRNFAGTGISLMPSGTLNASILNSVTNDNNRNDGRPCTQQFAEGLAGVSINGAPGDLVRTNSTLTIRNSVANNNCDGFSVTGATLTIADSTATGNFAGVFVGGAGIAPTVAYTYGDNEIAGNINAVLGTPGTSPVLTPVAKQ